MTTIHVAQRSAMPTILALPASADCTRRIMRWMELSSPTRVAASHLEGAELVDRAAGSPRRPRPLSTGRDSPVITAWSMEVWPDDDDAVHRHRLAGQHAQQLADAALPRRGRCAPPHPAARRAVRGVRWTRRSMPARALATVSSSSRPPSCMMKATSPAAKVLADDHRGDEGHGDQHVRLDVKGGDQADDGLQDDGHAAQDDGHPGRVERAGAEAQRG